MNAFIIEGIREYRHRYDCSKVCFIDRIPMCSYYVFLFPIYVPSVVSCNELLYISYTMCIYHVVYPTISSSPFINIDLFSLVETTSAARWVSQPTLVATTWKRWH